MDKPRAQTNTAKAFLAEWQKRYKITLHDISENKLQAMEEYAGQRREQAAHPDIEQVLNRVASHEITPAKAMELLQNWCDCASDPATDASSKTTAVNSKEIPTYPTSDWE